MTPKQTGYNCGKRAKLVSYRQIHIKSCLTAIWQKDGMLEPETRKTERGTARPGF
jgi:hypothetical protein